jgi:hypothetical protein
MTFNRNRKTTKIPDLLFTATVLQIEKNTTTEKMMNWQQRFGGLKLFYHYFCSPAKFLFAAYFFP